jgi:predicted metal-binding protein
VILHNQMPLILQQRYIIPVKKLVWREKNKIWCKLPYPNHPNGCPNFGKRKGCPPNTPNADKFFDLSKPLYLVYGEFDLKTHMKSMLRKHPNWSERQLRNVLYWQPRSKAQMKARAKSAMLLLGLTACHTFPEALGINMYATAALSGLRYERIKDVTICKHTALIGGAFKNERIR